MYRVHEGECLCSSVHVNICDVCVRLLENIVARTSCHFCLFLCVHWLPQSLQSSSVCVGRGGEGRRGGGGRRQESNNIKPSGPSTQYMVWFPQWLVYMGMSPGVCWNGGIVPSLVWFGLEVFLQCPIINKVSPVVCTLSMSKLLIMKI